MWCTVVAAASDVCVGCHPLSILATELLFRENTLTQPTWFMRRDWFLALGGYTVPSRDDPRYQPAAGKGGKPTGGGPPAFPEDLVLFHKHLDCGGRLKKVHSPQVVYR